jgi:hypothetical protein
MYNGRRQGAALSVKRRCKKFYRRKELNLKIPYYGAKINKS